ncbi:MAG: DNA polymerase III subunit delta [Ruminococcaceae bacterium]|nr:DNA polymerase III subunit delta [Oscillospiraceae bacterium]
MTETELTSEIKSASVSGIYFFYGDEDYLKNHRAAEIKSQICDDETLAAFNCFQFVFGDGEVDLPAISDALLSPPMLSDKKLVDIYFSSLDSLKERDRSELLSLLESHSEADYSDTVVIIRVPESGFDAGQAKRPSVFLREASKFMKVIEFEFQPVGKLHRWMERHFAGYGLTISPYVSQEIINLCGRSMYRLIGEMRKTAAYVASSGRREVLPEDVKICVTRTDEDDAFRLANCVLEGNISAALSALAVKMRLREDPIYLLSQITKVFSDLACAAAYILDGREKADFAKTMKMHEYKAGLYWKAAKSAPFEFFAGIMKKCAESDLEMKTGGADYGVIEKLICSCVLGEAEGR